MELSIRTRAFEATDELRELVERRLQYALDVFKDRIESVSVYLMDLNGPRKGVDKLCQITVRVRGIGNLGVLERRHSRESVESRGRPREIQGFGGASAIHSTVYSIHSNEFGTCLIRPSRRSRRIVGGSFFGSESSSRGAFRLRLINDVQHLQTAGAPRDRPIDPVAGAIP